jgi:hypothetical protein
MSCTNPVIVNIPGPRGAAGAAGTNGTNGINVFSLTTAAFTVPAFGSSVVVPLAATSFLPESVAGQFFVSVQGCGYLQVTDVTGLNVTLKNPLAGVLGIPNEPPTTVVPTSSIVTLAGALGATGAPGLAGGASSAGTYIVRVPDASIPSATALNSFSAGYVKTLGSAGSGAITTSATIPVADISGTLTVAKGGTGVATIPTNGQIPIGNGSGYTVASLTAGANITITPGAGTITIASGTATFNYVTFTRRLTTANVIGHTNTKNPFSLTDFPSGTWSGIDTSSGFNSATGKYTVPYAGYYKIDVMLIGPSSTGSVGAVVYIKKNGIVIFQSQQFISSEFPASISYIDSASISDAYDVFVYANGTIGSSISVSVETSFSVQRIQA